MRIDRLAVFIVLLATLPLRAAAQSRNSGRPARWDVWDVADSVDDIVVRVAAVLGLTQRIRIRPRTPRQGDTVYVGSRLEYSGEDSVKLTTRTCGYALRSEPPRWLQLYADLECSGYSSTGWWSRGSNDLNVAEFIVIGKPGTHRAFITDLLSPVFEAPFDVTIRPAVRRR